MIWGFLPFSYHWNPSNSRWSLASHDICFKNAFAAAFFTYGQTLPTQRLAHSIYGGLFQPTMTEVIRLLSDPHSPSPTTSSVSESPATQIYVSPAEADPFSTNHLTYTTNGLDAFPRPTLYPSRRHSWIHIFPEGMIHQHPAKVMRYFKWGVARLILEAEPCPDVLPIWIDGPQEVMSERRTWPRPVPRAGKHVEVTFGELVDTGAVFGGFRERWHELKERARRKRVASFDAVGEAQIIDRLGEVSDDFLRHSPEAEQLRIDVTLAVRNEVLKVRRSRGLPDEDPKVSLAETWRREGRKSRHEEGEMDDQSVVKDM